MNLKKVLASVTEKENYKGLYPLHYWLEDSNGLRMAVEDLRCWSKGDPQWEVVAPRGYIFIHQETHSLLGHTQEEVRERASLYPLVKCKGSNYCDCA
jgi:hypothetical protein